MIKLKSGLIYVLLVFSPAIQAGQYILPEPDYRPDNVAKPCLTGIIVSVEKEFITMREDGSKTAQNTIKIKIGKETSVFTVYGGFVMKGQLLPKQKLKVWYQGTNCGNPTKPLYAARIMLASENPGDDWPKE